MAVPSPAEVSAGCRYLAPALSPGTGIIPAYPGQDSLVQWCARDELQDIISHFREGLKSRLGVVVCQESGCVPRGQNIKNGAGLGIRN